MKSKLYRRSIVGVCRWACLTALLAWSATDTGQAATLSLEPSTPVVAPGGTVEIAIRISDLGDGVAPSVGAFDFNLLFDPLVFSFDAVTSGDPTLGDLLGPISGTLNGSSVDPAVGSVNLFSVSLDLPADIDSLQPSEFMLASVQFTGVGEGVGGFSLADIVFADAMGNELLPRIAGDASVSVVQASIPEASSLTAVLGLISLALLRVRRARRG